MRPGFVFRWRPGAGFFYAVDEALHCGVDGFDIARDCLMWHSCSHCGNCCPHRCGLNWSTQFFGSFAKGTAPRTVTGRFVAPSRAGRDAADGLARPRRGRVIGRSD